MCVCTVLCLTRMHVVSRYACCEDILWIDFHHVLHASMMISMHIMLVFVSCACFFLLLFIKFL